MTGGVKANVRVAALVDIVTLSDYNTSMTNYITIPGFKKLTKQQAFDMAASHLLTTGVKSMQDMDSEDANGLCSYAGSGGAASVFIKPYKRVLADDTGDWKLLEDKNRVPHAEGLNDFIYALQSAHDDQSAGAGFMDSWEREMRSLADAEGLSTAVLDA
jgi:hypothetical protein